ncbi:SUMF1/EgtB/PvdO family nonheme iron enzyme [Streptomyces sp. 029-5]|uniref:SUMF1/EgtB/PvdO family nonheme iron enzyme n=1 Tax=Streptomyces sp. 029-5 TaxID=2789261 RepID=UPI0039809976
MDTTTPVARYQSGVSPYGAFDMCGNVWEWCSTEETPGSGRYELKGSAFTSPFERSTPSLRNAANAAMLDNDTGFRCVTEPEGAFPTAVHRGRHSRPYKNSFLIPG